MIDLHLHTTASDGRYRPEEIAVVARRAGLTVIGVTDHDTVGGLDRAAAGCADEGLQLVPGIEVTAVQEDVDVHVLGYLFDPRAPVLEEFLAAQRADRVRRLREMVARLADLGLPVDLESLLRGAAAGQAVGRPMLAGALVDAGFVESRREAFDRYLGEGRPAWVSRRAPSPAAVVSLIHHAGGLASLAHPALLGRDEWISGMAASGLDAVEAYYSDHSPDVTIHYIDLARRLGLATTGGSDYHADPHHGSERLGECVLPPEAFEELINRRRRGTLS
ncbi:MAG TPA: PHP domain-containing protein [Vicinamibacterales bacterium]|nr:PHP domain-containing protein [Vicinamibacterales bacterium]